MAIAAFMMCYYLLPDVLLAWCVYTKKGSANCLSQEGPSLLTFNRNVASDFTVPVDSKGGLIWVSDGY